MKNIFLSLFLLHVQYILTHSNVKSQMAQCDPNNVQWLPHANSCTMYVLCFHGNPIERVCAPGLHFNAILKQCMLPQLAKCDINSYCPEKDDILNPVFLPDINDCTKYFVCYDGTLIGRNCAEGLYFDVVYSWCSFADKVSCDFRTPNNPNTGPPTTTEATTSTIQTTTITTEAPTTIITTDAPKTTTTTITEEQTIEISTSTFSTTTQDPNTYNCPLNDEVTLHPHPLECNKYFICFKGLEYLRVCADGLLFDFVQKKCFREDDAQCITGI